MLTELEKIEHLKQKYQNSKRLYTVYERSGEQGRYTFTLIYGTDRKQKAIKFVHKKELEGLFVIAYCAKPYEKASRCVHVSGMRNDLQNPSVQTPAKTSLQTQPSSTTSVKPQSTSTTSTVKGGV